MTLREKYIYEAQLDHVFVDEEDIEKAENRVLEELIKRTYRGAYKKFLPKKNTPKFHKDLL